MNALAQKARSIFLAAVENHASEQRDAYVVRECAGDAELRQRVGVLLRAHEQPNSLLDHPTPAVSAEGPVSERPGTVVGPYRLMEQIGEGGMGLVFVAEQQHPVRRKVALKVIKPGMDTREVIARFEAERQAIALMDHPNIAKVLDAGATDSGRPYFVMELVKGAPITEFCDGHRLPPHERLRLFIDVCQAVQHAHQKGVIHRDLKPANVLVTSHDGTPVVKVIDFGIAKAVGEPLTDKTVYTQFTQLMGTPLYMSPEQAGQSGLDIDTRTDIYALGVLLYELLTGTTPFESARLRDAGYDEIRRIIREEDPPKPSTRISTLGMAAATIWDNRQSDPKKLGQLVRGELDWIVMKAMEKDRNRRYEAATGLAMDVQRYLNDEPVRAGPPGAGYRLRKFVRRNRGPVLAASLLLATLVVGLAGTTWGLVRAEWARRDAVAARQDADAARLRETERAEAEAKQRRRADAERDRAEEERRVAEAVRQFLMVGLLRQADPRAQAELLRLAGGEFEVQENPTVKELLDRAAAELTADRIEERFSNQPRVQAEILQTIGSAYLGVGVRGQAIAHLTRARDLLTDALGPNHSDTLATRRALADALSRAGRTEAVGMLEAVRDDCVAVLGPNHPQTLATLDNLGAAIYRAGRRAEAVVLFEQVRDARLAALGPEHYDTLGTLNNLASAYRGDGQSAQAIALYEKVREAMIASLGADHPRTIATQNNLAVAYSEARTLDRSIPLFEETLRLRKVRLGQDHPQTLETMTHLGADYRDVGRQAEAVTVLEEAMALSRKRPSAMPANLRLVLAETYDHGGQFVKAEPLYRELLGIARKRFGAARPPVGVAMNRLGLNLLRQRKLTEAESVFRDCLALREKNGPAAWRVFESKVVLGGALLAQKKYAEAEPLLRTGYEGLKERESRVPAESRPRFRDALDWLIELADAQKDMEAAAKWRAERAAKAP